MQSIQSYYVAPGAVVTGDVILMPGVNIWFHTVIRGDLARIHVGLENGWLAKQLQPAAPLLQNEDQIAERRVAGIAWATQPSRTRYRRCSAPPGMADITSRWWSRQRSG